MTTIRRLVRAATALVAIAAIVVQAKTLADAGKLDLVNFFSNGQVAIVAAAIFAVGAALWVAFAWLGNRRSGGPLAA